MREYFQLWFVLSRDEQLEEKHSSIVSSFIAFEMKYKTVEEICLHYIILLQFYLKLQPLLIHDQPLQFRYFTTAKKCCGRIGFSSFTTAKFCRGK